ncbi:MAG: formyltransferase family protein [Gammaproteobacteria bacterium]|nr:formyltransferase family protein [Gammaproteobacteria bacterium]
MPRHTGLNTHQRVLKSGDPAHRVSVHFVTKELNGGPVIAQAEVAVTPDDTANPLAGKSRSGSTCFTPSYCAGSVKASWHWENGTKC